MIAAFSTSTMRILISFLECLQFSLSLLKLAGLMRLHMCPPPPRPFDSCYLIHVLSLLLLCYIIHQCIDQDGQTLLQSCRSCCIIPPYYVRMRSVPARGGEGDGREVLTILQINNHFNIVYKIFANSTILARTLVMLLVASHVKCCFE